MTEKPTDITTEYVNLKDEIYDFYFGKPAVLCFGNVLIWKVHSE